MELSSLIDTLNDRFGTDFTIADQIFFDQIKEVASADDELLQAAKVNSKENFRFVADPKIQDMFIERMDRNESIFTRIMNDPSFREAVFGWLSAQIYEQVQSTRTI